VPEVPRRRDRLLLEELVDRRRLDAEPEEPPEGVAGAGEPQRRARRLALDV